VALSYGNATLKLELTLPMTSDFEKEPLRRKTAAAQKNSNCNLFSQKSRWQQSLELPISSRCWPKEEPLYLVCLILELYIIADEA
jgi:hypothetical protein